MYRKLRLTYVTVLRYVCIGVSSAFLYYQVPFLLDELLFTVCVVIPLPANQAPPELCEQFVVTIPGLEINGTPCADTCGPECADLFKGVPTCGQ